MKIGIVGDIHWSKYSSIVRSNGDKYSTRLENCIESVNWAETMTADCDLIVYMGDFFDKADLNSMEITALKEIEWNNKRHFFLVGNHELGINDLSFSSSHIFMLLPDEFETINISTNLYYNYIDEKVNLNFIPYVLENNRGSIDNYVDYKDGYKNIVFSHNDLAGIPLGNIISRNGFSIEEIEDNCDLYFNGHLHNGGKISDKIINVGNLTGQNFSEDALKYKHSIIILDTDSMSYESYENPNAINFYKLEDKEDLVKVDKQNCVVTISVEEKDYEDTKSAVCSSTNVIASRITIKPTSNEVQESSGVELVGINHLDEFRDFVIEKLGNSEVIQEELSEVING